MNPLTLYDRYRRGRDDDRGKYTVTINQPRTRIRGKWKQQNEPEIVEYIAFLGIPYALPPIGRLRFAPPQPLPQEPFSLLPPIHKAYNMPPASLQISKKKWIGSEDCLYLNVYIPSRPENNPELLPVLVYIHGGGFERGSSERINPYFIVAGAQKCVLVAVNYRLGLLGFLNMSSDNCRGNAGLKDQTMALKWIRDNIAPFGGNPQNVTIFGQSGGGTCVNLHMISPLSKGLFHRAIVSAGGIYCPWGYGPHAQRPMRLFKRGSTRLRKNELKYALVESFKADSVKDLLTLGSRINRQNKIQMGTEKMRVFFKPSVEFIRQDAFLPDTAENMMSVAEPVPTIVGITKREGYLFYRAPDGGDPAPKVRKREAFGKLLKIHLNWCDEAIRRYSASLRDSYFPLVSRMTDADIREAFAIFMTDVFFRRFYDNFKIGNLSKSGRPELFVYQFDYFTGEPIVSLKEPKFGTEQKTMQFKAPEHGDDFLYVLGTGRVIRSLARIIFPNTVPVMRNVYDLRHFMQTPSPPRNLRFKTLDVVREMCQLWASFCKNGVPTCLRGDVVWRPHTEAKPYYLHIDERLSMENGFLKDQRWNELNSFCDRNAALESRHRRLARIPEEEVGQE